MGLSGTVLKWFKSYVENREYFVSIGSCTSDRTKMTCGVPQGSILGPLLFNLYMLPLAQIIRNNNISYHNYADDTQIYISLSIDEYGPTDLLITCLKQIHDWMCRNFLQLNTKKNKEERIKVTAHLESLLLEPKSQARN